MIFEKAGYAAELFDSPDRILKNDFDEPDLFLIDKQLRGADGTDLCNLLKHRKVNSETPIIIFSASPKAKISAINAGANGFLEKPFRKDELLNLVANLV